MAPMHSRAIEFEDDGKRMVAIPISNISQRSSLNLKNYESEPEFSNDEDSDH